MTTAARMHAVTPTSRDRTAYDAYLARQRTERSRSTLLKALDNYARTASDGQLRGEEFPWLIVTAAHAQRTLQRFLERGYSTASATLLQNAVRGLLREALKLDLISAEQYQDVVELPAQKDDPVRESRILSALELEALFQACAADASGAGVRDATLLTLIYAGGLYSSEVFNMRLEDFDLREGTVDVRVRSDSAPRRVYLSQKALGALQDWLSVRGRHPGPLFESPQIKGQAMVTENVRHILHRRARQAGIGPCTPSDLRETYLEYLRQKERMAQRQLDIPYVRPRQLQKGGELQMSEL